MTGVTVDLFWSFTNAKSLSLTMIMNSTIIMALDLLHDRNPSHAHFEDL